MLAEDTSRLEKIDRLYALRLGMRSLSMRCWEQRSSEHQERINGAIVWKFASCGVKQTLEIAWVQENQREQGHNASERSYFVGLKRDQGIRRSINSERLGFEKDQGLRESISHGRLRFENP